MTDAVVTTLLLDQLRESPFNQRLLFSEVSLLELAASIQAEGILQPITVRPHTQDDEPAYEIVFGHRRCRAAALAGLDRVPCLVRALTDAEAQRAQIHENLQREDVHPVEEAAGYDALMRDHGVTAEQLVEQTGKSRSYIYGRLKLCSLCLDARTAFLAEDFGIEIALMIARLPTEKAQRSALNVVSEQRYHLKAGYRNIRSELLDRFTTSLDKAIFDLEDAALVPDAGACSACPKRAANAPAFADAMVKDDCNVRIITEDTCTDPDCFAAKKAAHLAREAESLEAQGKVVIAGAKARQAISATGKLKGGYVALKDARALKKRKKTPAGTLVEMPTVVTIQDPRTGKTVQAYKAADLRAAGLNVAAPAPPQDPWRVSEAKRKAELDRNAAKAQALTAANRELLHRVREHLTGTKRGTWDLQLIAQVCLRGVGYNSRRLLADLWGEKGFEALVKRAGSMTAGDVTRLLLDCALVEGVDVNAYTVKERPEALLAAAKYYGIDVQAPALPPQTADVIAIAAPADRPEDAP